MPAKKRGFGASGLTPARTVRPAGDSVESPKRSIATAVREQAHSAALEVTSVPIEDLARYPDNPPDRGDSESEAIRELADSIRSVGIVQALVVVPAEAYVQEHQEHAEEVGTRPWVVLAGERRLTAARLAGLSSVPVTVRRDLVDLASSVPLHENANRVAYTPLQEARQFQRVLTERGMSQRELAKHLSRPQGQISKRLALLKLTMRTQGAIDAGDVQISDAPALLDLLEQGPQERRDQIGAEFDSRLDRRIAEHGPVDIWGLRQLWAEARDAIGQAAAVEAAQKVAENEGISVINPGQDLGSQWYEHQLSTDDQISAARDRGDLAVSTSGEDVTYWRVTPPPNVTKAAKQRAERNDELLAARKARKARETALVEIAATKPRAAEITEALISLTLSNGGLGAERTTLARKIAQGAGVGPSTEVVSEDWEWRTQLDAHPDRAHLAWIVALANQEARVHATGHRWDAVDGQYLEWLIGHGYTPTAWERAQLTTITPQGDSTESPAREDDTDDH